MNIIRLSLLALALFAVSEPTVAQQPPAQPAAQAPRAGAEKAQHTLRQIPELPTGPTGGSVKEQADLMRAQTKAIKVLAQKVDALEARVSVVEEKMKIKKPN